MFVASFSCNHSILYWYPPFYCAFLLSNRKENTSEALRPVFIISIRFLISFAVRIMIPFFFANLMSLSCGGVSFDMNTTGKTLYLLISCGSFRRISIKVWFSFDRSSRNTPVVTPAMIKCGVEGERAMISTPSFPAGSTNNVIKPKQLNKFRTKWSNFWIALLLRVSP